MSNPSVTPKLSPASERSRFQWRPYWVWGSFGVITNAAIWALALLYLKLAPPTYTSKWSLIVPGAASAGVNLNIPNIGQASSNTTNPPPIKIDPRNNYEYIVTNPSVLAAAAAAVRMSVEDFGEPEITLVKDSSIIEFSLNGKNPAEAQRKSKALYQTFITQVNRLRNEELAQRNQETQVPLQSVRAKLEAAQQRLAQYKAKSVLSSPDQIKDLSANLEQLRRQRAEILGQQQHTTTRLQQLSVSLKLSPQEANDAFILQADQSFQQYLKDYSDASGNREALLSKLLPESPVVVQATAKQEAAKAAFLARGRVVLGKPVDEQTLYRLNLKLNSGQAEREKLFSELIDTKAEQQGLTDQVQTLERQIAQLESRLKLLSQEQLSLDKLGRESQVAETVFSSTVAKLDLSQSATSDAYPAVHLISEPSLPKEPSIPDPKIVFLGTLAVSFLATSGIVLFWLDKRGLFKLFAPEELNSSSMRKPWREMSRKD
jgi:uncharacterized protein involved in exopolysaccharide biosynthesis